MFYQYATMPIKCSCVRKVSANFGLPGERAKYCAKCRPDGAINVYRRTCQCDKKRQPRWGLPGTVPRFCSSCPNLPPGSIDVYAARCSCPLKKYATYGVKGSKKLQWCASCKPDDAVDVHHRKCQCARKVVPSFAIPGEPPEWCIDCESKPPNAVSINSLCECGRACPSFGLEIDAKRKWCKNCKPQNAISLSTKCECGRCAPSFGLPDDKVVIWCQRCAPPGALHLRARRCSCELKAVAHFGRPDDSYPTFCKKCPNLPDDAKNLTVIYCLSEWCDTISSNSAYRGYCLHCFVHLFPDEEISRNYLVKEKLVRDEIDKRLREFRPDLHAFYNKQISGGCSRKRPDTFVDALTHGIFGEVDESQHDTSEYCSCENKRMMSLMNDIGLRSSVFVRLNPDDYVDSNGVFHASCFTKTQSGKLVLSNQAEFYHRVEVYWSRIKYHIETRPEQEVQIEHLFYDGFNV